MRSLFDIINGSHFSPARMQMILVVTVLLPLSKTAILALSPLDASTMSSRVTIRTGVEFHPTTKKFDIHSAMASLAWFPRESYHQKVSGFRIHQFPMEIMAPRLVGENIELYWEDPCHIDSYHSNNRGLRRGIGKGTTSAIRSAEFCVEATVNTVCDFVPVRQRIPFPLGPNVIMGNIPNEYLQPGRIADQSLQIQKLARNIVSRENELFHAVFAIATYVHRNIKYSLQSTNRGGAHAATIQLASRVISSRQGKCDEMTALFISMIRSLGIPARFISGYAYTNHEMFESNWGGHTWAEVFFPGVGWVPFDVTYGQYGYVDAGHIQLSVSHDAKFSGVNFNAHGLGFKIIPCEMETHVDPKTSTASRGGRRQAIDILLNAPETEVGFQSNAVVVATVRNNRDHFVAAQLNLVKGKDITLLNNDVFMDILLEPGEVVEIPYFFLMDEQYQPGFSYKYPFSLSSRWSSTEGRADIVVRDGAPMFYAKH